MQPLLGCLEPRLEAMALPALGLDQHNPCRLHEQDPQVAIAALGYLAEDGAVAGRYLLGDEPQPGGEVAAFRERIAGADCGHHRAGACFERSPRSSRSPQSPQSASTPRG